MKKIIIIICLFVLMGCQEKNVELIFKDTTLEYGEKVDFNKLLETDGFKITKNNYDSMTLGEQKVSFTVVDEDKKETESTYTFTVEDTKAPEIVLKEETVTVEFDSNFNPKDNVKICKDPVDGDVEYTTEGEVKTSKAGEYTVTISAEDKNGNESSVDYKVVVKEKEKENVSNSSSSGGTQHSSSNKGNGSSNNSSASTPSTPSNNGGGNNSSSSSNSSSNNSNSSGNSSGSSSEPQVCTPNGEWKMLGNSGFASYSYDEAWDYAENNAPEWHGAFICSTHDVCGNEGWTVEWYELTE